jgi:kumamolisin
VVHRILIAALTAVALLFTPRAGASALRADDVRTLSIIPWTDTAYTPPELQRAYDFGPLYRQGLNGAGQTIGLIEIDGFHRKDVQRFDSIYGLPRLSVTEHMVGPKVALPVEGETTMDVEWIHALAPKAALQIYYVNAKQSLQGQMDDMATAINDAVAAGVGTISMSLGICAPIQATESVHAALTAAFQKGITVFVSSGDDGDLPGPPQQCGTQLGVSFPASDPTVVAVGGTSLKLTGKNTIKKEYAWRLSGGGTAMPISRAPWQVATSLPQDAYRWSPDVSFIGDPQTGVVIYLGGKFVQGAGTSLGAPCWAAMWAMFLQSAQQQGVTVGPGAPLVYSIGNSRLSTTAFHDILTGNNGYYKAGSGWDPVTGWGSPDAAKMLQAVLATPTTPTSR